MVKLLVENGADVNGVDQRGRSPVLEACAGGHVEVLRYLLEREACQSGGSESVKRLLQLWVGATGTSQMYQQTPMQV